MNVDWLQAPISGEIYALIFGLRTAVCLTFGLHALMVTRGRRRSDEHWWESFPAWLGLMLLIGDAVTTGTFAVFFYLGAATLTAVGLVIYVPGTIVTIGAFLAWTRLDRGARR